MRSPLTQTLVAALLLASCGPPRASERLERPRAAGGAPATDRDPIPYTPPPSSRGATDELVSLAAAGGEDQARRMLPAFLRAVRDADERELHQLLADEVGSVQARRARHAGRPRANLVQRILVYARRSLLPPDVEVAALVDLERLRVSRAGEFWQGRPTPSVVLPTDLVLEVPLLEPGRGPLRTLLGWSVRGHLVVRPGRDARIVAM